MRDPALAIPYVALCAAMMRALFVRAGLLPPTCDRCGRRFERGDFGDAVCSCDRR